ncbi:hypothetical protein ALP87_02633 [Pseudomonas syringae pv. coriandricola]|uniref:hypothetical protein n=1 Tax=Pseudomonas syringae group genomosp. 3 TaxID=251701 RepID=UPI000F3E9DF2|nr:hypothetical protein [Pseudomonas syringae group genomosp. 3]RMR35980.1 hypothetical protein ALP87_02633 [Pseudomonas syringae pv. coriandricola]
MKKILCIILYLFCLSANAADSNTPNFGKDCVEWSNEFSLAKKDKSHFVETEAVLKCRSELFTQTLDYRVTKVFASAEFVNLVYNILSKYNAVEALNDDEIGMSAFNKLRILFDNAEYAFLFAAFAMLVINAFLELYYQTIKKGEEISFAKAPRTILCAVVLFISIPVPGLDVSLIRGLLVALVVFAIMSELTLVLLVLPNIYGTFNTTNIDEVNPAVRENALYVVEQRVINPYLLQKKCELLNRNNLIFTLSEQERSRLLASSSQRILDFFTAPSSVLLNGPGGRAYDPISNQFNKAYSELTDGSFSMDCGFIKAYENKVAANVIASHGAEVNNLMSDIIDYSCSVNKDSMDKQKSLQASCLNIKDGKIIQDDIFAGYVTSSKSLDTIRSKKKELITNMFNDLAAIKVKEREATDQEKAQEMLNAVKAISAAALPYSIVVATLTSPTYMDYLNEFDKYEVNYSQRERDSTYAESLQKGQIHTENFYIAKDDVSLNQIINMQIFKRNSNLSTFINQKTSECHNSTLNCKNSMVADLGNIQNVAFNHLNTANNIKWGMMVASLINNDVKKVWSFASGPWNIVIASIIIAIFVGVFAHPLMFVSKKVSQVLKFAKAVIITQFTLLNFMITSTTDNQNFSNTSDLMTESKGTFISLSLERFVYTVGWCIALFMGTLFATMLYDVISFTVEQDISGTIFLDLGDFIKIIAVTATWGLGSTLMFVAPDVFTNLVFLNLLKSNRETAEDSHMTQGTIGWYQKVKRWTKPYF